MYLPKLCCTSGVPKLAYSGSVPELRDSGSVPELRDTGAGRKGQCDVLAAVEGGEDGDVLVRVGEVSPSEGVREHHVTFNMERNIAENFILLFYTTRY